MKEGSNPHDTGDENIKQEHNEKKLSKMFNSTKSAIPGGHEEALLALLPSQCT